VTNEVEAAIEDAYELAKRWLVGKPDRLAGYELNRHWKRMTVLSFVPPGKDRQFARKPIFGGSDGSGVYIYDDQKGAKLIADALSGDSDAHAVLCGFAAYFVGGGNPLPEHLRKYISDKLFEESDAVPPKGRGRNPDTNRRRNFYIMCAIVRLRELGVSLLNPRYGPAFRAGTTRLKQR
jgi:hypothetical protein